jgi:hypothetical protein
LAAVAAGDLLRGGELRQAEKAASRFLDFGEIDNAEGRATAGNDPSRGLAGRPLRTRRHRH